MGDPLQSKRTPAATSHQRPESGITVRGTGDRQGLREPIYLASQLASICDVDLKTIHNWCDRNADPQGPPELECFRTPGGHLRFRHSSVVRFLGRWGYPIPDALLRDRPHVLLVEPDEAARARWIALLGLVRPGEDEPTENPEATPGDVTETALPHLAPSGVTGATGLPTDPTLGLWATGRYYVHLWHDPYLALIALGERTGAGAPPDLAVLAVPTPGLDARAWLHAAATEAEGADGHELRFVLVTPDGQPVPAATEPGVVSVVPRADARSLRGILDQQAALLMGRVAERASPRSPPGQRKRRIPIAPREPIFVASQVANIWDVDLKTVHNWVERGDIEAFRTPGRHLRFRRRSLLHFLRRYNMAIPQDLVPTRPRVMVIDPEGRTGTRLTQGLGTLFDVIEQPDPVAALVDIGGFCAGAGLIDAVVVTLPVKGVDDMAWLTSLALHPDTRYTRVVVVSQDESRHRAWQDLGVTATVHSHGIDQVTPVLERALGLTH